VSPSVRRAFNAIARVACEEFTRHLKPRRIMSREGDSVYLERFYICGGPSEDGQFADEPIGVMLHRFVRSDEDGELHNHPWEASASLILAGGYSEERRLGDDSVERREFGPFSINVILANHFHRVDLLEKDAWTLFVVTRKAQSWGFWHRITKAFTPWREFIAQRRGVDASAIQAVTKSEDIGGASKETA